MLTYDEAVVEIQYWLSRLEDLIESSDPSAAGRVQECVDALVQIGDLGTVHVLRRLMEKAAPDFRAILAKGAELLEPVPVRSKR